MLGPVIVILRMIAALTAGGLGLVLVTPGATEWEVRRVLDKPSDTPPEPLRLRHAEGQRQAEVDEAER
jgi:hypothetical protein